MSILPKPDAYLREAIILIGGAVLASFILSKFPAVRAYINADTRGEGGCGCS